MAKKFEQLSETEKRQVISELAENAPDKIKQMATDLSNVKHNDKKIEGLGYITAIEILMKIGRLL